MYVPRHYSCVVYFCGGYNLRWYRLLYEVNTQGVRFGGSDDVKGLFFFLFLFEINTIKRQFKFKTSNNQQKKE